MVHELMAKNPVPIPIQYAISFAGLLVTLLSGIFMLRGKAWARFLYVVWGILGFIFGIVTSPMKPAMIPGAIVFVVVVFFLFRPKASEFFSARTHDNAGQGV
ncbi:hypothetical protein AW736_25055 [Termitidicoccus mucosus]|uniref:Uncharacterized protein n=2 Tax=Termitidicoccus mucosus TaxID=1184151 RepID=A0A178IDR5_9BACT|nr:hypothetical protein AW736_25055 [Opitutaceae bacterium TSB47]